MSGFIKGAADFQDQNVITDAADVVIIGTGAAGAVAGKLLSEAGLEVIFIEEGPMAPEKDFPADSFTALRKYWRDSGFQSSLGRVMIPFLQGRGVGGSTIINGAIVRRIPEKIHDAWVKNGHIDDAYSLAELNRVFDAMDRDLQSEVTPEDVLGKNNTLMRKGLEGVGAQGNSIIRFTPGCKSKSRCWNGCPVGAKRSMHLTYIPQAVQAGARVYADCLAEKIVRKDGRAAGVVGKMRSPGSKSKGKEFRIEARKAVFVAASAINTPVLLKSSGIGHSQIGENLMVHPGVSVLGRFEEPVKIWFGGTQAFETTHWWEERMKFETVGMTPDLGGSRFPGYGAEMNKRMDEYGHIAVWGMQARAQGRGQVKKGFGGNTVIKYNLAPEDIPVFKKGMDRMVRMMFAAGAKEVFPAVYGLPEVIHSPDEIKPMFDMPDDSRLFHFATAHIFGTARMHPDRKIGATDVDGQLHDLPGAYIVDSSIFPSNLGVNPQYTISAMTWLITERFLNKNKG